MIAQSTPGARRRLSLLALPAIVLLALAASTALAADETLLLQSPTISREHVVFRYAGDLWLVGREGGDARRLTSNPGDETNPQLSPDGKLVAFTGEYEGNADVYVMSIDGGMPRRLTWHPGYDAVVDWHPDGKQVLFTSYRDAKAPVSRVYLASLDADAGSPEALELPKAYHVSVDAKAQRFAYTPVGDAFGTWKRYRGGRVTPVWIFDRKTREVEVVPRVHASDTFPNWIGDDVYFASDRDGVMNLYRYTPGARDVQQLTRFREFHIRDLDAGGGALVYEQKGRLHVYEPERNRFTTLAVVVRDDGLTAVPRWQQVRGAVRAAAIAPNGKRAVFEARGEIITVPKEHGDKRNLTSSPGAHDRSPVWSHDGEKIAWFSDESGEYRLVVGDRRGRGEAKSYDLKGGGFYHDPRWSPDGEHVLFNDKTNRIAYITLENGKVTEVGRTIGSLGVVRPAAVWSWDSKWIAFELRHPETMYDRIALYELASGETTVLTDDFAAASHPAFSRDGKHLYFFASDNVGPNMMGLNMNAAASRDWDGNLYVAVLQADGVNPLFPRSDEAVDDEEDEEEDGDDAEDEGKDKDKGEDKDGDDADAEGDDEEELPAIDLANLDQRILALPVDAGLYGGLACADGKLYFVSRDRDWKGSLMRFDYDEREAETLAEDVRGFSISGDGKSLLLGGEKGWSIADAEAKDPESLGIEGVKVRVEPGREWPQILREVWRIERDYFYDENMHGVDWDRMWKRWEPFLPHVKHRAELTLLIRELIGELSCGHEYVWGGDYPDGPDGVSVGLLGAEFETDGGRYRIARILRGQNWNPGVRSPLTEPGVDAAEGDYIIAVNGAPLRAGDNLFRAFENTAGEQVELELSRRANGKDARVVTIVPLGSEWSLRRESWIEANRRRVDELSGGRLAYVYMRNTGGAGRAEFDRDFYSQLDKEGLVLDERYNGGGKVADYVIEVLSRKVVTYWMNREKWLSRSPSGVLDGPKVMVVNENAGSGGDWMPWAFQNQGLGKLVGTTTWGGLVGISGYPPLMDGGYVTAASFGVMNTDGEWIVENVGVKPDVEVIEWPKQVLAGADPQLDRAVAVAMEELARRPKRERPGYSPPAKR